MAAGEIGPSVERWPFDEEERSTLARAEPPQLAPQPARCEGQVRIAHSLALDECSERPVVRDRQSLDSNLRAEPLELVANRRRLVHVHYDADHLNPMQRSCRAKRHESVPIVASWTT